MELFANEKVKTIGLALKCYQDIVQTASLIALVHMVGQNKTFRFENKNVD